MEQIPCRNINSSHLLNKTWEHFSIEITFTNLSVKFLPCKLHINTIHSAAAPAYKPLRSHWLSPLTSPVRTFPSFTSLQVFKISGITGLLKCLFKFKIHINTLGRRKEVTHYQIPVLFMNKTNISRLHTEMR